MKGLDQMLLVHDVSQPEAVQWDEPIRLDPDGTLDSRDAARLDHLLRSSGLRIDRAYVVLSTGRAELRFERVLLCEGFVSATVTFDLECAARQGPPIPCAEGSSPRR
jgi:hypothetical protein